MIDLSIKKLKIHVIVNEHNSKKFNELLNENIRNNLEHMNII
jgi:hypothetical protein